MYNAQTQTKDQNMENQTGPATIEEINEIFENFFNDLDEEETDEEE